MVLLRQASIGADDLGLLDGILQAEQAQRFSSLADWEGRHGSRLLPVVRRSGAARRAPHQPPRRSGPAGFPARGLPPRPNAGPTPTRTTTSTRSSGNLNQVCIRTSRLGRILRRHPQSDRFRHGSSFARLTSPSGRSQRGLAGGSRRHRPPGQESLALLLQRDLASKVGCLERGSAPDAMRLGAPFEALHAAACRPEDVEACISRNEQAIEEDRQAAKLRQALLR